MIGNSVAYHLVQRGWSNIVIIDKGGVADGTSKHGSGMLGLFRPQHERSIVQYCIDLYQDLQEQGHDLGLEHCGGGPAPTDPLGLSVTWWARPRSGSSIPTSTR